MLSDTAKTICEHIERNAWEDIETEIFSLSFAYPINTVHGILELMSIVHEKCETAQKDLDDDALEKLFLIVSKKFALDHLKYGSTDLCNFSEYKLWHGYWSLQRHSFAACHVDERVFSVLYSLVLIECAYADGPSLYPIEAAEESLGKEHFLISEIVQWTKDRPIFPMASGEFPFFTPYNKFLEKRVSSFEKFRNSSVAFSGLDDNTSIQCKKKAKSAGLVVAGEGDGSVDILVCRHASKKEKSEANTNNTTIILSSEEFFDLILILDVLHLFAPPPKKIFDVNAIPTTSTKKFGKASWTYVQKILEQNVPLSAIQKGITGRNMTPYFSKRWTAMMDSFESARETAFGTEKIKHDMVLIRAGSFMMGALDEEFYKFSDDERPRHKVNLTHDFWTEKYAVTQELWESVMGYQTHNYHKGPMLPVTRMSWFDCLVFCNKLSVLEGLRPVYEGLDEYQADETLSPRYARSLSRQVLMRSDANGYRLLTEAEWEYAARGGGYHRYAGSEDVNEVAWYAKNSDDKLHPVGKKKANGYGLHDMSGNVWEWVWDWYSYGYSEENTGVSLDNTTNPTGAPKGRQRVLRGGCFTDGSAEVYLSFRENMTPDQKYNFGGFRFCRTKHS